MKIKNYAKNTIIAVIFAAIGISLFTFNPEKWAFFPKCPFLMATGYKCPGCGSQRAFHKILHGDIYEAFLYNPLMVIFIPYVLIGIYFEYLGGKQHFPKLRNYIFGRKMAFILIFIIFSYAISRNIYNF